MNLKNKKVVILGGGIAGLSLAWRLKQQFGEDIDLVLLEQSSRFGGWIHSRSDKEVLFELGPRSCRTAGAGMATLKLVEELGLQSQVIVASPNARHRYLYYENQLKALPSHPLAFLTSPLTRNLIPTLLKEPWKQRSEKGDESIEDFFSRRFNPEFSSRLIDPMVSGIFAGDISKLSIKSCFPKLWEWENKYGSLLKGMFVRNKKPEASAFVRHIQKSAIFSFKGGMEILTKELTSRLEPHLNCNKQVVELIFGTDQVSVKTKDGSTYTCDHLYSTIPSHALAPLLSVQFPDLTTTLNQIPFTSVVAINLAYSDNVLSKKGFGYLIPSSEKEEILGVVWDSSVFPEQNSSSAQTRLTVMMGGAHHPHIETMNEDALVVMALKAIKRHLGISQVPNHIYVHVAKKAIPQYLVGHEKVVENIDKSLPKQLTLYGNSFKGVSINDIISSTL